MFPDLRQLRQRIAASLGELSETRQFRVGIAAMFACLHLLAFAKAGHDRLDLPFNNNPGERPYYSDPDAPAVRGYPRQPHRWSRLIVSRWDAQIYIGFAVRGVTSCPTESAEHTPVGDLEYLDCGLGWLPAYGMIGGELAAATGIADDVALVMISVLCAILINLLWTSPTMIKRLGRREAYGALIAFNIFPTAFYLVAPYTESTTIALALAGFVALANERWLLASFFVGASTAFRASAAGFTLGLCLVAVLAAWKRRQRGEAKWWRPLGAIPLSGWGMAVQMLMLRIFVGDFMAYTRARSAFGDYQDFSRLVDPEFYLQGFTAQHMDAVMLIGSVAVLLLVGKELAKRLKTEELVFLGVAMAFNLIFSIAALHEYWGLNRYLLVCPPIFMGCGIMLRRHPAIFVMWLVLCAAIYWHVELCSYISHGNSQICPCLGRLEFGMPFQS